MRRAVTTYEFTDMDQTVPRMARAVSQDVTWLLPWRQPDTLIWTFVAIMQTKR